jgi:hypothetical protein
MKRLIEIDLRFRSVKYCIVWLTLTLLSISIWSLCVLVGDLDAVSLLIGLFATYCIQGLFVEALGVKIGQKGLSIPRDCCRISRFLCFGVNGFHRTILIGLPRYGWTEFGCIRDRRGGQNLLFSIMIKSRNFLDSSNRCFPWPRYSEIRKKLCLHKRPVTFLLRKVAAIWILLGVRFVAVLERASATGWGGRRTRDVAAKKRRPRLTSKRRPCPRPHGTQPADGFLSLTPGPSPFSSTKITPADSSAARKATS